MPRGKYNRKKHELPEEFQQIKHATIKGASNYIILEDKRVWSKRSNKFLTPCIKHGYSQICLILDNGTTKTTSVE